MIIILWTLRNFVLPAHAHHALILTFCSDIVYFSMLQPTHSPSKSPSIPPTSTSPTTIPLKSPTLAPIIGTDPLIASSGKTSSCDLFQFWIQYHVSSYWICLAVTLMKLLLFIDPARQPSHSPYRWPTNQVCNNLQYIEIISISQSYWPLVLRYYLRLCIYILSKAYHFTISISHKIV